MVPRSGLLYRTRYGSVVPMIAIDVREACRPVRTGKGQWTYGLVTELIRRRVPLTLFTDAELPDEWKTSSAHAIRFPRGLQFHSRLAHWLNRHRVGLTYVSPLSYVVPALVGKRVRTVVIVHDLIAFQSSPHDKKARAIERLTLGRAVRSASAVCTISESTKQDLLRRFPRLAPRTVEAVFAGPAKQKPPMNRPDGKTILCIGTLSPRKNQRRLVEAFAMLPDAIGTSHRLVIAGARGWNDEDILSLAKKTPGVVYSGPVNEQEYERLLTTATILALPSLYEGFGMQVLDALQRGLPVLTSKNGSLPELCGTAAEYVDPLSVEDIARGLSVLLSDASRREELSKSGPVQAARFSWENTADLLLKVVEKE